MGAKWQEADLPWRSLYAHFPPLADVAALIAKPVEMWDEWVNVKEGWKWTPGLLRLGFKVLGCWISDNERGRFGN